MTAETTILPQADREWWPADFVDEICPGGRPTPDAWIEKLHDGAFVCRDDDDPESFSFALAEGEVVEFVYCDSLPGFTVLFDAVGQPHYSEPPASANWFWDKNEHECCGDTIVELLRNADDFDDVEEIDVGCCHWNKDKQLFRFTALDGPPRFVAVVAEQAAA